MFLSEIVIRGGKENNLSEGNWRKVLFMPTGALLSKTSFNEGMSVPGIAHGLVLEAME